MVDHLTRITVAPDAEAPAALADALAARGFEVRRGRRIVAESRSVEGGEAKAWLLGLGFRDRDFRVFVEYVRRWGIL